ncbi:MAG: B12-binding domain-containing protein [Pyrinomonadaceae bacterium]
MISKSLTTREVAHLCRVSNATVKRWEDAGLLNSERTSGGHRRFRAEEVARFQREQNLGLKLKHGDESVVRTRTRRVENSNHSDSSFFHSLVAGAEAEAANLLITAHLHGNPLTDIFDDLICSAMNRIGELWYKGELSVAQEHLATRTAHHAIHTLRQTLSVPEMSGELAMCCGIEGDFHELPTHLAQLTIENEGWEVLNFGANMPLHSMTEEIFQHSPEMICISATLMPDIERISRDYKDFRERIGKLKIPVIIGGRAFSDGQIRTRFPAEFYAESFKDVAGFVKDIARKY